MEAKILRLNMAGQPVEWLHWKECATLYARDIVAWSLGGIVRRAYGGRSRITGEQTYLDVPAIIACDGKRIAPIRASAPLNNTALFCRDNYQCMYCGHFFDTQSLSRDHVHPVSLGGKNRWENVVTACKRCNQRKGNMLLDQLHMELIALPYRPNPYEYLALINSHRIRGDQLDYLRPQFSHYKGRLASTCDNVHTLLF